MTSKSYNILWFWCHFCALQKVKIAKYLRIALRHHSMQPLNHKKTTIGLKEMKRKASKAYQLVRDEDAKQFCQRRRWSRRKPP